MKNKTTLIGVMALFLTSISCQKMTDDGRLYNNRLENAEFSSMSITCPIPVSGVIDEDEVWTTGNVYKVEGVVEVTGAKLTIEPGVTILMEKATKAALVIHQDAILDAEGTECAPIVFTSDQAPNSRAPGDWKGLIIAGNSPNNQSNSMTLNVNGTSVPSGGTSTTGNSHVLKYVQIHYAGARSTVLPELRTDGALILGSLGTNSTIEYVQITNSATDGLSVWGGLPDLKYIFNYEVERTDFKLSYGYRGNMQFLLGFKDQATAHATGPSYGMEISNNLSFTDADAAPYTYPTISQLSLLGGNYCEGDDVFGTGIQIERNGNARIYNSVVSSFNQYGLFLQGADVVAKTAASPDPLQFSYNTLHNINSGTGPGYSFSVSSGTWFSNGGCVDLSADDMSEWINGSPATCSETDNDIQILMFNLGYTAAFCGNKCTTFPSFDLNDEGTDLQEANYENLNLSIFSQAPYTGALQPSGQYSWIQECNWMSFCMQTTQYCI